MYEQEPIAARSPTENCIPKMDSPITKLEIFVREKSGGLI
jgi:hypothetical protein